MSELPIGRLIRVDLSSASISEEPIAPNDYRRYLGGSGLVGWILLRETDRDTEPFSEENPLIFVPGALTGTPIAGSGRSAVGGLSPLTNGYGCSEGGGYFPAELRKAGIAAMIVTGRAPSPVYIQIDGEQVSIRRADDLWGTTVDACDKELRERLGRGYRTAVIGPAGEKMVRFASIHHDVTHACGRTGMGALMGWKRLKAVACKGSGPVPLADPETIKRIASDFGSRWRQLAGGMNELGTPGMVMGLNTDGGLPTYAFRDGAFAEAEKLSGTTLKNMLLVGQHSCWACPIRCKRTVEVTGEFTARPELGGPEYETLSSLGSLCGIDNLEAVCAGNALCNAVGMDTISAGVAVAFYMECCEKGLITDGPDIRFGDAHGMVKLVEMIGNRQGVGDWLAEGVERAATKFGEDAKPFVLTVRGQEFPMHEPRYKPGIGLGYAVSPTGADHCHNYHDTMLDRPGRNLDIYGAFGLLEPTDRNSLGWDKLRTFKLGAGWRHFNNTAVLCNFVPWAPNEVVELVRAITGWQTSLYELFMIAERSINMARLVNIRRGLGAEYDRLPDRVFEPLATGALAGKALDREEVKTAIRNLYAIYGWDEQGRPTPAKLAELGISWAIDYLDK